MRQTRYFVSICFIVAVAVVWCLPGCGADPQGDEPAPVSTTVASESAGPTFTGRASCVECHEEAEAAHAGSHHDLAMDVASEASVLGAFDGRALTHDGVTTTFSRDGDAFIVETDGPDGEPARFEVTHVFGVIPLQQYMVSFPGGRRQMLRQAWDARPADQGGQRWFALYPDQHIDPSHALHWTRPSQTWNHMCAECHSTNLVKGYDPELATYDTTFAEVDVSCEACHGPCSEHVAWAESLDGEYDPFEHEIEGLTVDLRAPEREWKIDPETGTAIVTKRTIPSAQIETCARCHSRRGQIAIEPVEGQPLLQTHRLSLLSEGLYHADGQMQDEVFVVGSFLQSRMYSAGVECSDCHDSHGLALRKPGNELCVTCHDAAKFDVKEHHFHEMGTESAQCVVCHMRSVTYMVVDPRRDHSLRIPRPDLTLSIGSPNACDDCHADKGTQWSADAVEKWYGEQPDRPLHPGEVLAFGRRGGPGAAEALVRLAGDRDQAGIVRATALELLAGSPGHPAAARAVVTACDDPDPLVRLGAVRALGVLTPEQRVATAAPLLRDEIRAVRIDVATQLVRAPEELLPAEVRKDLEEAIAEVRTAEQLNADQPEAWVNLGNLELALGDLGAAEAHYRTAIRVDDSFLPSYVNLADALRVLDRDAEGEKVLRRGLERAPGDPGLSYALAMLLIRDGRREEALEHLSVAAESHSDPRAEMAHALLLKALGSSDASLTALTEAARRHPGSADLAGALLGAYLQLGDTKSALRWAEHLSSLRPADEQITRILRDLRAREAR